eukprot:13155825-Alexandrium_andersonii.AAC.1
MASAMGNAFDYGVAQVASGFWEQQRTVRLQSDALATKAESITKMEYYSKQSKWVEKRMKDDALNSAAAAIMKSTIASSITKILQDTVDPVLLQRLPLVGSEKARIPSK